MMRFCAALLLTMDASAEQSCPDVAVEASEAEPSSVLLLQTNRVLEKVEMPADAAVLMVKFAAAEQQSIKDAANGTSATITSANRTAVTPLTTPVPIETSKCFKRAMVCNETLQNAELTMKPSEPSPGLCFRECQKRPECEYFTFWPNSGHCGLCSTASLYEDYGGRRGSVGPHSPISGPRSCVQDDYSNDDVPTKAWDEQHGKCDADDFAAIDALPNGTEEGGFGDRQSTCGGQAFSIFSGFNADVYNKCMQDDIGLSDRCASCYSETAKYGTDTCKAPCIFSWCSKNCLACTAPAQQRLGTCTGRPSTPVVPCSAFLHRPAMLSWVALALLAFASWS